MSGPGGPKNSSKMWGANPPTFLEVFQSPRGQPTKNPESRQKLRDPARAYGVSVTTPLPYGPDLRGGTPTCTGTSAAGPWPNGLEGPGWGPPRGTYEDRCWVISSCCENGSGTSFLSGSPPGKDPESYKFVRFGAMDVTNTYTFIGPWTSPKLVNLYALGPWMSPNPMNLYALGPWMSPNPINLESHGCHQNL